VANSNSDVTSTDKLLEVIRGESEGTKVPEPDKQPVAAKSKSGRKPPKRGKGQNVGVEIGAESLRLVKLSGADASARILDYRNIPYDAGLTPASPEFATFLRDKLRDFTGGKKMDIWSSINSAKVDFFHKLIPKVSKKKIAETVYWTVKKEKQFDEKEYLLDFEVQGQVEEQGQPKTAVMVYLADRKEVQQTQDLFAKAGHKLTGLTLAPLAIQNYFRSGFLKPGVGTYANLFVGKDWSRIDVFTDDNLILSRGIKTGTESMVESIVDEFGHGGQTLAAGLSETSGPPPAPSLEDEDEDMFSIDFGEIEATPSASEAGEDVSAQPAQPLTKEEAHRILFASLLDTPLTGEEPGAELTDQQIFNLTMPAVDRLVRQVERTFDYYTRTLGHERIQQVYLSGEICASEKLREYVASQLDIQAALLDPMQLNPQALGALSPPTQPALRVGFAVPTGLALSDTAKTPNLLFTYKDREALKQQAQVKNYIYAAFLLLVLGVVGVFFWMRMEIDAKKDQIASLETRYAQYDPVVDELMLAKLLGEAKQKNDSIRIFTRKYETMAAIGELSSLTPPNIKLLNLSLSLGVPEDATAGQNDQQSNLVIDGMVLGDPVSFESTLTGYLIKLQNSVLYENVEVRKREVEEFNPEGEVYRFILNAKMK
jgi:Tfp pilus assembly PilM family ATPase